MNIFDNKHFSNSSLSVDSIYGIIETAIINAGSFELFNEDTDKEHNDILDMLDCGGDLNDKETRRILSNAVSDVVCDASWDAFEKGTKLGLSLLKALLCNEPPKIKLLTKLDRNEKSKEDNPEAEKYKIYLNFMTRNLLSISDIDKCTLQDALYKMKHRNG